MRDLASLGNMQNQRDVGPLGILAKLSILVSLLVVPMALPDPVLGGFTAWLAIALGGLANIGRQDRTIYTLLSFLISFCSLLYLRLDTRNQFESLSMAAMSDVLTVLAIPLFIALLCTTIGFYRQRC